MAYKPTTYTYANQSASQSQGSGHQKYPTDEGPLQLGEIRTCPACGAEAKGNLWLNSH